MTEAPERSKDGHLLAVQFYGEVLLCVLTFDGFGRGPTWHDIDGGHVAKCGDPFACWWVPVALPALPTDERCPGVSRWTGVQCEFPRDHAWDCLFPSQET
jgi:hypothetical protein